MLRRELIAFGLFLGGRIARRDVGIQIAFFARLLVLLHPGGLGHLAHEEVDFLEVAAGLAVLLNEQHQPGLECALDPVDGLGVVPLFGGAPIVHRGAGHAQQFRDVRDAPACPVQKTRLAFGLWRGQACSFGLVGQGGGQGHERCADLRCSRCCLGL